MLFPANAGVFPKGKAVMKSSSSGWTDVVAGIVGKHIGGGLVCERKGGTVSYIGADGRSAIYMARHNLGGKECAARIAEDMRSGLGMSGGNGVYVDFRSINLGDGGSGYVSSGFPDRPCVLVHLWFRPRSGRSQRKLALTTELVFGGPVYRRVVFGLMPGEVVMFDDKGRNPLGTSTASDLDFLERTGAEDDGARMFLGIGRKIGTTRRYLKLLDGIVDDIIKAGTEGF